MDREKRNQYNWTVVNSHLAKDPSLEEMRAATQLTLLYSTEFCDCIKECWEVSEGNLLSFMYSIEDVEDIKRLFAYSTLNEAAYHIREHYFEQQIMFHGKFLLNR